MNKYGTLIAVFLAILVGFYVKEKARRGKTLTERFPLTEKGRPVGNIFIVYKK